MKTVDSLIRARRVIPVRPRDTVYEDYTIAIDKGHIAALIPQAEAAQRFKSDEVINLRRHIVMPGLVNAHTKSAMGLLRGLATAPAATAKLSGLLRSKLLSSQFVRAGSELAVAQMLRAGITCFNDTYLFPEESIDAMSNARMRAVFGLIILDRPSAYAKDAEDYIAKSAEIYDRYKDSARIRFALAPSPAAPDDILEHVRVIRAELDLPVHINLHRNEREIKFALEHHGCRPLQRLDRLGLVSPALLATHALHLEKKEIGLLQKYHVKIVHCPQFNMREGQSEFAMKELIKQGVTISLGSGSPTKTGTSDMFGIMRDAFLLARLNRCQPAAFDLIEMATLGGARALGLENIIGSAQKGKAADLIAVRYGDIDTIPAHNVADYLIHSARASDVRYVWVGGQCLLRKRAFTTIDEQALMEKTERWSDKINKLIR